MEITIKDVLKKAIEMEENGKIFYEYAASIIKDENVKKVMSVLATEEVGHRHVFENMLNEIEKLNLQSGNETTKYLNYLNEYISSNSVFDRKKFEEEKDDIKNITSAIDFAIDREMDSILYYMTLMTIVKEEQAHLVQKIIDEERKHFIKLTEVKNFLKK